MFKQRVKYFVATLFGILVISLFSGLMIYAYMHLPPPRADEADPTITLQSIWHAGDPVMLYQTVGIKECGGNYHHKIEKTRAVLIDDGDFARVKPVVQKHFEGDITAALYTNTQEGIGKLRGEPTIIPLRKENGTYCALGLVASYSRPLFLDLEAKYQPLLNQQ